MDFYYGGKHTRKLPPTFLKNIIAKRYREKIKPFIKTIDEIADPDEYSFARENLIGEIKKLAPIFEVYINKTPKISQDVFPFMGVLQNFLPDYQIKNNKNYNLNHNKNYMKKFHNSNGEHILIAQMTDEHLINTIHKNLSTIAGAISMAEANPNNRERLLYGVSFNTEDLKKQIERAEDYVLPYVYEATIRGLDITHLMQAVYGRKSALPTITDSSGGVVQLPSPESIIKTNNGLIDL